jgi:hypothetical protein
MPEFGYELHVKDKKSFSGRSTRKAKGTEYHPAERDGHSVTAAFKLGLGYD